MDKINDRFLQKNNQSYLASLYLAIMVMGYFSLMRVGEMTASERVHAIKFKGVNYERNKKKIVIASKTHYLS